MQIKDVVVDITRQAQNTTKAGFRKTLILSSDATTEKAYKEYSTLTAVLVDYANDTPAYKAAAALFAQVPKPEKVAIVQVQASTPSTIVAALTTVTAEHNDWYFLLCTTHTDAMSAALDTWIADRKKLYFTASSTDTLAVTSSRTVVMHHDTPGDFPEAAWIGECSTFAPGECTWKFKTLVGIEPMVFDDQATEVEALHALGWNTYITKYGVDQTSEGITATKEFIDVIINLDYLEADIEAEVAVLLQSVPKVPYDDTGITMIAARVDKSLTNARNSGVLQSFTMSVPKLEDLLPADVLARKLNAISFTGIMAQTVHTVQVNGVVTY